MPWYDIQRAVVPAEAGPFYAVLCMVCYQKPIGQLIMFARIHSYSLPYRCLFLVSSSCPPLSIKANDLRPAGIPAWLQHNAELVRPIPGRLTLLFVAFTYRKGVLKQPCWRWQDVPVWPGRDAGRVRPVPGLPGALPRGGRGAVQHAAPVAVGPAPASCRAAPGTRISVRDVPSFRALCCLAPDAGPAPA